MPVVDVRKMRVVVSQPRVLMNVGVLMVDIMLVPVPMLQLWVLMVMGMVLDSRGRAGHEAPSANARAVLMPPATSPG